MEAIASSFLLVAASEMGDKTQLLAFSLASKYRRPWVVMAGILAATLLNHGLASTVGTWVSALLGSTVDDPVRRKFEGEIKAGRILVVLDAEDPQLPAADDQHPAGDATSRHRSQRPHLEAIQGIANVYD